MNTAPEYKVHASASIQVRALVLPRAQWETEVAMQGRAYTPVRGTWCAHVERGRNAHDVTVVAMIACPSCGGLTYLSHSREAARILGRWMGGVQVPVAHSVDHLGKVSPDILCKHGRCDFHRTVYLDRWNKTKALFAIAYVDDRLPEGKRKIEIAYSHAVDTKEARFHLGPGKFRVIAGGPAIGFFVDVKTGRMTAD